MKFPNVSGYNLLRQQQKFPRDLAGQVNLLFVPFQQWQQAEVDSWLPAAERLAAQYPGLVAYELPTIQKMNRFAEFFINEGMRAGIPNPQTREHTITLYLDKAGFRRALEIANEDEITVLLVDRQGELMWRTTGRYTPEKERSLGEVLTAVQAPAARARTTETEPI